MVRDTCALGPWWQDLGGAGGEIQLQHDALASSLSGTISGDEKEHEGPEGEWTPPDAELVRKLVEQIEFYLSDENLERDAFLLKHVRRNRLGYVSVKLLTSLKKVCSGPAGRVGAWKHEGMWVVGEDVHGGRGPGAAVGCHS